MRNPRVGHIVYAWLSAGIFVAALAYTARFLLTVTALPATTGRPAIAAVLLNTGLFGVFAAHHSVMARTGAKQWLRRWLAPELERATYVWIASVLLILTCVLWQEVPGVVYGLSSPWRFAVVALPLAGLGLIASATAALDPLELAGVRQVLTAGANPAAVPPDGLRVTVKGPYRWVRHPIYLGWILVVFGTPEMSATRLAFAIISTAYLVIAVPWEERDMRGSLGEEYERYTARVRWRIVPGVW